MLPLRRAASLVGRLGVTARRHTQPQVRTAVTAIDRTHGLTDDQIQFQQTAEHFAKEKMVRCGGG